MDNGIVNTRASHARGNKKREHPMGKKRVLVLSGCMCPRATAPRVRTYLMAHEPI